MHLSPDTLMTANAEDAKKVDKAKIVSDFGLFILGINENLIAFNI